MTEEIPDYLGLSKYIGQQENRSKINFYIHSHRKTGYFPSTLVVSAYGLGKTELCRAIAQNLISSSGTPKIYVEINGSSLKSVSAFHDQVYVPFIAGNEVTVMIDEFQKMSFIVQNWLLTALNPNSERLNYVDYNGGRLTFDFSKLTVLAASTNTEQILKPLISRFCKIVLGKYSQDEIKDILVRHSKNFAYEDGVENEIVGHLRGNPREAAKMAFDNIGVFVSQFNKSAFGSGDWAALKRIIGIKPLGLNNIEIDILKYLKTGHKTLTNLAAYLNLDKQTAREFENFLLSERLIMIDGTRQLTEKGGKLVNEL